MGSRVWGLALRDWGSGSRYLGWGFRVYGFRFRDQGLGRAGGGGVGAQDLGTKVVGKECKTKSKSKWQMWVDTLRPGGLGLNV